MASREQDWKSIVNLGGMPLLIGMVKSSNRDAQAKAVHEIAEMSVSEVNRNTITGSGLIPVLISLLRLDSDTLYILIYLLSFLVLTPQGLNQH